MARTFLVLEENYTFTISVLLAPFAAVTEERLRAPVFR
jgi:hypothetical protein